MKQVIVIAFVVVLSALLGYGALHLSGWRPYSRELIAAGIPSMIAGMGAIVPALLQRPHGQAAVVQGAFQGMIVHMGATMGLSVVAFLAFGPSGLATQPFGFWALWFFFVTLTAVSWSLIRLVRSTPIAGMAKS